MQAQRTTAAINRAAREAALSRIPPRIRQRAYLERRRPIWFGGVDRSEASLKELSPSALLARLPGTPSSDTLAQRSEVRKPFGSRRQPSRLRLKRAGLWHKFGTLAASKRHQVALLGARKCLSDQVSSCGKSWPGWTFNPLVDGALVMRPVIVMAIND